MRYWWANQNQTYRHEVDGGYLWSPKRKANGGVNPFYESMREVAPGDIVLSFADTRLVAIGIAQSHCYECPKPVEFGSAGMNWDTVGWKVEVRFTELENRVRPADRMDLLRQHLPRRYSPLLPDGRGSQAVYLTEIPLPLFEALGQLIGREAQHARQVAESSAKAEIVGETPSRDLSIWEDYVRDVIARDATLGETQREAVIQARSGQGIFRQRVSVVERHCRVTGVSNHEHLRASHCKPWRDSTNEQRLDGENGLLLTPSIDHLFDRGFIGFEGTGVLLVSPVAHKPSLEKMGVKTSGRTNVGAFSEGQRRYLEWHQEYVFLQSQRSDDRKRMRGAHNIET
jgi:putative restriction endonuclease